MRAQYLSRLGRVGLSIALSNAIWLALGPCAAAEEAKPSTATPSVAKPSAADPPDRVTPYNKATLELAANTIVTRDIPYTDEVGEGAKLQTLDIYVPEGARALPVVVYVHGGGWSRGDKREVGSQPKMFNERGLVFVAVNYRLSPEVKYPTHVNDIAAGIAWVRGNIDRFGGNPRKLVVMGHSAGAHLASLVATHPGPLGKQGMKVSDLKGAISLDGSGFDLVERLNTGDEKVSTAYSRAFGTDRAVFADASPIKHLKQGAGTPPFLLTYVNPENVNYTQAKAFADQMQAAGGRVEMEYIQGKDHATLASDLGTTRDTAGTQIVDFVRSVTAD